MRSNFDNDGTSPLFMCLVRAVGRYIRESHLSKLGNAYSVAKGAICSFFLLDFIIVGLVRRDPLLVILDPIRLFEDLIGTNLRSTSAEDTE